MYMYVHVHMYMPSYDSLYVIHIQRFSLSGILDEIVAAGPVPALVMALTLKVYEVRGLKSDISTVVVLASCTNISREESGPITCTLYPVMTPFCLSTGRGVQEIFALDRSI